MLFVPVISGNARAFRSGMSNRAVPASSFLCQRNNYLSPTLGDYRLKNKTEPMRCHKCGYENTTGITCVKCGTPLKSNGNSNHTYHSGSVDANLHATQIMDTSSPDSLNLKSTVVQGMMPNMQDSQLKSTIIQTPMNDAMTDSQLKSTILQNVSTPSFVTHNNDTEKVDCPKCGYPITASFTNCPNCGANFMEEEEQTSQIPSQSASKEIMVNSTINIGTIDGEDDDVVACNVCDNCNAEVPIEFSFCPHCGSKIALKTIPSIHSRKKAVFLDKAQPVDEQVKKICHLELIPDEGEERESVRISYEGANIVLNRENTEIDNRTITSKEQAILSFEDGKWFIENKSNFDSTFIFAGRKLEVHSGDVLMLGNRRFKFETE